jgi:hypothetical protein
MEVEGQKKTATEWQKIMPYNELIMSVFKIRDNYNVNKGKGSARGLSDTLEGIINNLFSPVEFKDYAFAGKDIFSIFSIDVWNSTRDEFEIILPWTNNPDNGGNKIFRVIFILKKEIGIRI